MQEHNERKGLLFFIQTVKLHLLHAEGGTKIILRSEED